MMKLGRKARAANRWAKLADKVRAGDVSFNSLGEATVYDGEWLVVPKKLLAEMPAEIAAQVEANRHRAMAEAKERSQQTAEKLRRERELLDARLDEPGFTLLAGEETEIVASGTLRECRESLPRVTKCRRNSDVGKGCWEILASDGAVVEDGYFDRHGLI